MAIEKRAPAIRFDIYIAGDYNEALNLLQKYVERGECVSCTPIDYVYKYGREAGICVSLVNYPRFSRTKFVLEEVAKEIADYLLDGLGQGSYMIAGPDEHYYYDRR